VLNAGNNQTLSVTFTPTVSGTRSGLVTIEDNGIGIRKDFDINKIKSVGLNLVSLMVKQLDGKIQFISENGTKIIIEFPPITLN